MIHFGVFCCQFDQHFSMVLTQAYRQLAVTCCWPTRIYTGVMLPRKSVMCGFTPASPSPRLPCWRSLQSPHAFRTNCEVGGLPYGSSWGNPNCNWKPKLYVNTGQLFHGRRDERVSVTKPVVVAALRIMSVSVCSTRGQSATRRPASSSGSQMRSSA